MLSDCNRISFFSSGFSDIPRKISAYLRTESSSGANMRIMRGFHIVLIINDLYLIDISSHCEKHHFGLRNGPYRVLKQAISHPNMGVIGLQNGQYRNTESIFSDYDMGYMKSRYVPKRPPIHLI